MSNIPKIDRVDLRTLQKYVSEYPDKAHPDFDVILDAMIKLEQTNQNILAHSENYPELNTLILDVSNTLRKAQLGLESAATLSESLPNEGNTTGNNE